MRLLAAALVLGLVIVPCTDASALVLCQKKRRVVARASCRPGEQVLSLADLGIVGSPGAGGTQGPPGPPPLRVVDAVGTDVGPVANLEVGGGSGFLDFDSPLLSAVVTRPPLPDGALLGVTLRGRPAGKLHYASTDCTGTPLVSRSLLMPVLQAIGDTVFSQDAPSAEITGRSVEVNDLSQGCVGITPRGSCCRTEFHSRSFDTAVPVTTLTELGIVPPLRAVLAQ